MNNEIIKKWIEAVGMDKVLKSPSAMMLIEGAKEWAKDSKLGLELQKTEIDARISELEAKKADIDIKLSTMDDVKPSEDVVK